MATTDEPKITMDTIRQCAPIICQYMNRESLLPYLLHFSLLTDNEMHHFTNANNSPSESNNYLIKILENKDSDSAQRFYQCLQMEPEHTGHSEIVEHLRNAAKLQGTTCKENAEEMNATSSNDESEKETNLVKPEELKAMVHKKKIADILADSVEAKMCQEKTQILLVTANVYEYYAALSLLEPMEGNAVLLRFRHSYTGPLAKVATYTVGKFGAFNAAVQRMTTPGTSSAQDVITIAADCFRHNLNAIFSVGVACGVKKDSMLDVLVSEKVTFYKVARRGINEQGKLEIKSRELANLPTSDFFLQHFANPPEWPTDSESSKTAARLTTKMPKKCTGLFLSGDQLVDNKEFKDELLNNFAKEAIGIEMEGAGLYHDYRCHNYEILIVKAVCDFGDGTKNKDYQPTAALLAAECLHHYLNVDIMPKALSIYKKGNAPVKPTFPNQIVDYDWEQYDKKQQIEQPQPQQPQLQLYPQAKNGDEWEQDGKIQQPQQQPQQPQPQPQLDQPAKNVRRFTEEDIKIATENFSDSRKLGSGGFGVVYQGHINRTRVAVKKLTEDIATIEGIPEKFRVGGQLNCEVWVLTRCRHKNLVELVGYCSKPPLLVYEYMEEGNLHDWMFKKKRPLSWEQRSKILKDICRGLAWLHGETPPIMHGDVKLTNILLDQHLSAKLGDLGFAQQIPPPLVGGHSFITAAAVAFSKGYNPPEKDDRHISPKTDMYSYGVVALELFTGLEAYSKGRKDRRLIDHLDEERKTLDGYKTIADKEAPGDLAPYLVTYKEVIEGCLLKHSKRSRSNQIMQLWETKNF